MEATAAAAAAPAGRRPLVAMRTVLVLGAAALAAEATLATALAAAWHPAGPVALAALGNLLVALRFGVTLLPGRDPLITRYGRFDPAGLPDGHGAYTRRLTAAWAALLGGFALLYAAAALGSWPVAALAVAEPLACAGLFLGEHALRNRRFPQHGRATPLRTLRAIRLSYGADDGARHAA